MGKHLLSLKANGLDQDTTEHRRASRVERQMCERTYLEDLRLRMKSKLYHMSVDERAFGGSDERI